MYARKRTTWKTVWVEPYGRLPTSVPASPEFARRLRAAIEESDFSLRGLQEKTGVDKNTISSWQCADRAPGSPPSVQVEKVVSVAGALGLDPLLLLGLPVPAAAESRREDLLRELHREIEELEEPTTELLADLSARIAALERLRAALPELKELTVKALSDPGGED